MGGAGATEFRQCAGRGTSKKQRSRRSGGLRAIGAGGNGYAVQRSLRGLNRADVRVGPTILFDRPPCRIPRPLLHPISFWPRHSVMRAGPTCEGSGGAAEFFRQRGRAGGDVEEAAVTEKRWPSSDRRGREWVRRTAIATRAEQGGCQGGAHNSVRPPPVQDPPSPPPSDFLLARPNGPNSSGEQRC